MGTPDEIATPIAFLCMRDAAFITGFACDTSGSFTLLRWGTAD
jgi:hypothetical protein